MYCSYLGQKRYQEALDASDKALQYHPDQGHMLGWRAAALGNLGLVEEAKLALNIFIAENESNQLSGSAHYWLGKLFIFEKNHREAAIILLEGVQKYPSSIKASEMLLVLSDSLIEMNKNKEACKILDQLINDYPKSKSAKKVIIKQSEISCSDIFE